MRMDAYVVVSDDGCIADADGRFPDALKHDAEWDFFSGRSGRG